MKKQEKPVDWVRSVWAFYEGEAVTPKIRPSGRTPAEWRTLQGLLFAVATKDGGLAFPFPESVVIISPVGKPNFMVSMKRLYPLGAVAEFTRESLEPLCERKAKAAPAKPTKVGRR
jgi:hypothetical protein